eukprot:TRINITY_DN5771_c0_g3_i1.p1 TRINITY_DN5771_c0_g3~~TRINITY_DN5771_c0_g3_i1.p1  ORF type:complete len:429 (-),score=76.26 TRINITY_DN5771_c0_g3_i1:38-1324(-)
MKRVLLLGLFSLLLCCVSAHIGFHHYDDDGFFSAKAGDAGLQILDLHLFSAAEVAQYEAKCIDGSPAGFYFSLGSGENATKWFWYLQGGGYCLAEPTHPDVEYCTFRRNSTFGSSKHWPPALLGPPADFLSSDPTLNPDYHTWGKIAIPYCSGDLYAGQLTKPLNGMYQTGHNIITGVLGVMREANLLDKATEMVIYGESAGGFGATINADYIAKTVPQAIVTAFPNGGWFIDIPVYPNSNKTSWANAMKALYNITNAYVNQGCLSSSEYHAQPWACLLANNSYAHWNTRAFIAQNIYDTEQMEIQDGVPIPNNILGSPSCSYVRSYASKTVATFGEVIASSAHQAGIFAPACFIHVISPASKGIHVPGNSGVTLMQSFSDWYFGRSSTVSPDYKLVDPCLKTSSALSCNPTCSSPVNTKACDGGGGR